MKGDDLEIYKNIDNLSIEEDWEVQGRILPPSTTKGNGCILHFQTHKKGWLEEHFHVGRSKIPAEMGVELLSSIVLPPVDELLRDSFDPIEQPWAIDYLSMVKLKDPQDTLGFITVNGLMFLVQIPGLEEVFNKPNQCKYCTAPVIASCTALGDFQGNLDDLMLITDGEKNH